MKIVRLENLDVYIQYCIFNFFFFFFICAIVYHPQIILCIKNTKITLWTNFKILIFLCVYIYIWFSATTSYFMHQNFACGIVQVCCWNRIGTSWCKQHRPVHGVYNESESRSRCRTLLCLFLTTFWRQLFSACCRITAWIFLLLYSLSNPYHFSDHGRVFSLFSPSSTL